MGLRGSGKTTIGRRLADALGMPFIDLDEQVLATFTEDSVGRVWAAHGEQAWRRAESSALTTVVEDDDRVIALGGGTPMIEQAVVRSFLLRLHRESNADGLYDQQQHRRR